MRTLELFLHRIRKAIYRRLNIQTTISAASVFSHNMVLQREMPVPIWGNSKPHARVKVSFGKQTQTTVADKKGNWQIKLTPLKTNKIGETLLITTAFHSITLHNVVVGEVWICSGQSNMGWTLELSANADEHIASAVNPLVRFLPIPSARSAQMENHLPPCCWAESHPEHAKNWSAVGFHFATELCQELDMPIGIIWAALGATKIQEWTSQEINALHAYDIPEEWNNNMPSSLFNTMIAPLIPYAIRGVAWYQGEENHWGAGVYQTQQAAMIEDWRERWGQGSFPFVYVQLANFGKTHSQPWSAWAELQEAQLHSLVHPNTAMAVAIDLGEADDIHPRRKQPVGQRLAIAALGKVYGCRDIYSGPLFRELVIEGNKLRLFFDHTGGELKAIDGKALQWFEIAEKSTIQEENLQFVPATAVIDGDTVVIWNPDITQPMAARYAYNANPEGCNLCNSAMLPASPFRSTKDWSSTIGNNPNRPIIQTPVASHQRISTHKNASIDIKLHAFWNKNTTADFTQFEIVDMPKLGILEGKAPHLTYHCNSQQLGVDKFTFRVKTQFSSSNLASVIVDISEPIIQ